MSNTDVEDKKPRGATLGPAITGRIRSLLHSRIALAAVVGMTAVAVMAEPFGTHGVLSFAPRVIYWALVIAVSVLFGEVFHEIALRTAPKPTSWQVPLRGALLMTLGFTPFVLVYSQVFISFGALLTPFPPEVFFSVFVVSLVVYSLVHVVRGHMQAAQPVAETESPEPRLAQRLETATATVYRLSADDHLTEVASDSGVERLRMRFADAVNEMEPVPGLAVHRSHWVTLASIEAVERRGGKLFVRLVNGETLPVSRTYRPGLEAARPELF